MKSFKAFGELPTLPSVQYLYHGGRCMEWGMVGWVLESSQVGSSQVEDILFRPQSGCLSIVFLVDPQPVTCMNVWLA